MTRKLWTLVAFKHPDLQKSVYYRQDIVNIAAAVETAIKKGANLMSIRGFEVPSTTKGGE